MILVPPLFYDYLLHRMQLNYLHKDIIKFMIRQYSLLTGSYSFPLSVNGRVVSPAKTDPAIQWLITDRDHHAPHPSRMQASDSGLVLTYPMNQLRSVSHSTSAYQKLSTIQMRAI